ncbi:MAG TPA: YnfA family protein [Trueperaceae bacterium]
MLELLRSLSFFVLAGLLEIGGGYAVWLWLRDGQSPWLGLLGAVALALYGVVATLQPATFGRVYAAYGGIFIAMAVLWGWFIDKKAPDRFDLLGALIALVGVGVIMYWPRA